MSAVRKLAMFVLLPLAASTVAGVLVGSESPVYGATIARALVQTLSEFTALIWLVPVLGGSFAAWRLGRSNPLADRGNPWYWAKLFWKTFLPVTAAFVGYSAGTFLAIRSLVR